MNLLTIVEWATIVVTFIVLGSGLPVCINMYKTGSTKNVPYPLFLVYCFVNLLSLKYAIYNSNSTLMTISVVSLAVFGTYIAIFLAVSKSKGGPFTTLTGIIAVYLAHVYYLTMLPSENVVPTIGLYMRLWCTILALLPAMDVVTMLREQSSEACDMPILIATTINASVWYLYGSLSNDINIWAPNVPALILCIIKFILVLYFNLTTKSVVHPVKSRPAKEGFVGHDFHKEVYNVRSRKPLPHE